ncbi:MAG: hypothetical protein ACLP9L_10570 [Thermoguttaceae bacterium]
MLDFTALRPHKQWVAPTVTPTRRPTPRSWIWAELVAIEPRLLDVAKWAARTSFSWSAYQALKAQMRPFVGSKAQQPELRTSAAWDVAGQHLLDRLQRGHADE